LLHTYDNVVVAVVVTYDDVVVVEKDPYKVIQ